MDGYNTIAYFYWQSVFTISSFIFAVVFVFYRRMVVPVALGGSGKIFQDQEPQLAQEVGTLIFNKGHSLPYQKPF